MKKYMYFALIIFSLFVFSSCDLLFNVISNIAFPESYTITSTAGAGGNISPSGAVEVEDGDDKTFAITAYSGYTISNVRVDGISRGAISSYTFWNVSADHTISVTFKASTASPESYTITSTAGAGGNISPSGAVEVEDGDDKTFTITAYSGYTISEVRVDGISRGAISSYTFWDVSADHTISATFKASIVSPESYTITSTAGAGGNISPSGAVEVEDGDDKTFAITADSGYSISEVRVDGINRGALSSYTFWDVSADHTISATFDVPTTGVPEGTNVALSSNGGTASAISEGTYLGNTCYAYEAIDGNRYDGWSSNWSMPAWLKVEFDKIYTIDTVAVGWGSHKHNFAISLSLDGVNWTTVKTGISSNTEGSISYESFPITPRNAKYMKINITSTSAPGSHIFQSSVHELEAYTASTASPESYTITSTAGAGGNISPSGAVEVEDGDDKTFAITADSGYSISEVRVDGINRGALSSYTFWDVSADHTISATFDVLTTGVPEGTNVALSSNGGTASAISEGTYLGNTCYAYEAIDGDRDDGWSSNWSMPAWLKVEFDKIYTIDTVAVGWGSHKHNFAISLSLDGVNWTTVKTGISSNTEGSISYESFPITPRNAKYMKINITSTSAPGSHIFQSSVHELEAYTASST